MTVPLRWRYWWHHRQTGAAPGAPSFTESVRIDAREALAPDADGALSAIIRLTLDEALAAADAGAVIFAGTETLNLSEALVPAIAAEIRAGYAEAASEAASPQDTAVLAGAGSSTPRPRTLNSRPLNSGTLN